MDTEQMIRELRYLERNTREVLEWPMGAVFKTAVDVWCTTVNRGFKSHPPYTY